MNIDEYALQLADNSLSRNFDPEAYLVKYVAELRLKQQCNDDLVEGSTIDDNIQLMLQIFVTYYNDNTDENLKRFLAVLKQIICELYYTCNIQSQKEEIQKFLSEITNI
ncbi:MAG: hypothetical protein IKP50_00080 [Bacilli bacterium]|nr:hypothetical protein [Bacilli bacterium]